MGVNEESAVAVIVAAEVAQALALTPPEIDVVIDADGDPETLPPTLSEAAAEPEEEAPLEELARGEAVGESDARGVEVGVLPAEAVILAPPETLGE